ncbi:MAG TPA: hypothetical protein VFP84_05015 [Kofleriaceae bacterium]|nr:hypothetical protein [Kofleriaceae bacterium]
MSAFAALALIAGCAGNSQYVYAPDAANATAAGLPAARTAIPQEQPQGAIEVASYGVTDLKRDEAQVPALHVRAIVTNDGDATPWTFDTTQQMVEIPGEGKSRAMWVNADTGTLPIVTIGKGERRVLDFYFPLPDTMRDAAHIAEFDLLWQVHTAARVVASRTSFDRVDKEPPADVAYVDAGWPLWAGYGPYWWYDPLYPGWGFPHVRPYVIHGHWHGHGRVVVGRFGGHFRAGGGSHVAHGGRGHR